MRDSSQQHSGDSSYLEDLHPAQLQAVTHCDGPLLVFAGAGSGKTRVLTRRVAHLICEHAVSPTRILAVTFTNKAAREMKGRIATLIGNRASSLWAGTFHSICARILRENASALDYTPNFVIYDSSDSRSALKRVYQTLKIDKGRLDPRYVSSRIDWAKNNYQFPEDIREDPFMPREQSELLSQVYEAYQAELRASNAMDFGDLLCNAVMLFTLEPEILREYQERFQYLLIDEYQDTNQVQYRFVNMLSDKRHNLCVVGDDDQSIYAFRGATIENILNFRKDYPEAKVVTLDINYRSTKTILEAANSIIAANSYREKKSMKTENPVGEQIVCHCGYDERDEAGFVVREVETLTQDGVDRSQIAVFYRTNAQSRAIEEMLCSHGIPYEIFGGHRFYERKEIKDVLAYLRLLVNGNDNEAFLRVVNTPARGIGPSAVGALSRYAEEESCSLLAALEKILSESTKALSTAHLRKFQHFYELISELRSEAKTASQLLENVDEAFDPGERVSAIMDLLKAIAEKSTYLQRLKAQDNPEAEARIENIHELFRVAYEFVDHQIAEGNSISLGDFIERASLTSDLDEENTKRDEGVEQNQSRGAVSLMTLHLAKGLEFDYVFLIGMEDGLLPHIRSIEEGDVEEERRLCYVGITRAKKRLFLSRASSRTNFSGGYSFGGRPSRFLRELPREIVEDVYGGFFDW